MTIEQLQTADCEALIAWGVRWARAFAPKMVPDIRDAGDEIAALHAVYGLAALSRSFSVGGPPAERDERFPAAMRRAEELLNERGAEVPAWSREVAELID